MDFAIAKVSTKGQIVIPSQLRAGIKKGDEFLMVKDNGRIILKSVRSLAADVKGDLIFAERIEKAWQRYDKGQFREMSKEDFLKELEKW
ncbi:MAG: AbrB/MazE/SpoVT family DNA-binding domain-containing protein [Candidatus Woesearchaeota archaeon]